MKHAASLVLIAGLVILSSCSSTSTKSEQSKQSESQNVGSTGDQGSQASAGSGNLWSTGAQETERKMTPELMANEMALNQLHHINQKEIAMAELAQEKGQSAQVKRMAEKLVRDHEQLDQRLQTVAQSENITLASFQLATHEAAMLDQLNGLEGREFDAAFLKAVAYAHEHATGILRRERANVQDKEIRALIDSALPNIERHRRISHGGGAHALSH